MNLVKNENTSFKFYIEIKFDSIKTAYNLINTSMTMTNVSLSNRYNTSNDHGLIKIGSVKISFKLLQSILSLKPVIKKIYIDNILD